MKKNLLALCALFAAATFTVYASQPLRRAFNHQQGDGTSITIHKIGNRDHCFYSTSDGYALLKNTDGNLCYALLSETGLSASEVCAHNADNRNEAEKHFVATKAAKAEEFLAQSAENERPQISTRALNTTNDGLGTYGQPASGKTASIGTPKIPVVLVEFADRKFAEENDSAKFSRWFNLPDYSEEKHCVSCIAQYFSEQSDNMFAPSFHILGKVTTSKGYAYYGANTTSGSTDKNMSALYTEIIDSLASKNIDFKPYLKDGKVPLLGIIHAGPGEQSSFEDGSEDFLYAHFRERTATCNGTSISSYLLICELMQNYEADDLGNPVVVGSQIDGMGTFAHEFCHALGLPDYYSTNGTANETPHMWAIMDYGQYLYDGYRATGLGAYERSYLGWLEIEELGSEAEYKELYALGTKGKPTAYLLRNDANPKEYFILENRQDSKWFPKALGQGMLVMHIDYLSGSWSSNTVNNSATHQRISVVRADNEFASLFQEDFYENLANDLYPGGTNNTELSDTSTPATAVFTGSTLGKPIYNIALSSEGVISFSYLDKEMTSGIDDVVMDNASTNSAAYTPDGRSINNPENLPAGTVYIKNGKKFIKR